MGASCKSKAHGYTVRSIEKDIIELESDKPLHEGSIFGLSALSETAIVSCGEDKRVAVYNWDAPLNTTYFTGHSKAVNRVAAHFCAPNLNASLHTPYFLGHM